MVKVLSVFVSLRNWSLISLFILRQTRPRELEKFRPLNTYGDLAVAVDKEIARTQRSKGLRAIEDVYETEMPTGKAAIKLLDGDIHSRKARVFTLPAFFIDYLKNLDLETERLQIHTHEYEAEAAETIHQELQGSSAIVQEKLIIEEGRRKTRMQHASTIVEVQHGELLAAWFGGRWEQEADVGIWMSRFKDGMWSLDAWEVVKSQDGLPCWNPVLLHLPDIGETVLFYKVGKNTVAWKPYMIRSYDNGRTWGEPEDLKCASSQKLGRCLGPAKNKLVVLKNGTWLAGCSDEPEQANWTTHVELSHDRGRTWLRQPKVDFDGSVLQPTVFEVQDGLMMLMRSKHGFIVRSRSRKGSYGAKWEPGVTTDIKNPNSGIDAVTLSDGRIILVFNPLLHVRALLTAPA
uniref:Bnr asp-box repeat family protein n=1 Tax=Tetraselmis sp. GSL018 TaxID=582737 RepID=A0A061RHE2_9CHLO